MKQIIFKKFDFHLNPNAFKILNSNIKQSNPNYDFSSKKLSFVREFLFRLLSEDAVPGNDGSGDTFRKPLIPAIRMYYLKKKTNKV